MAAPSPSWNADEIVAHLRSLGTEENRAGMARFGINTGSALGISNAVLRPLGRALKRDHERALALWASGIREARLLALFTDEPKKVTREQAERYAADVQFLGDRRSRRRPVLRCRAWRRTDPGVRGR